VVDILGNTLADNRNEKKEIKKEGRRIMLHPTGIKIE